MASISSEGQTGRRTIQFILGKKRHSIRLGKVSKKQAESVKRFIEDLVACKKTGDAPKGTTAEWLAGMPDIIRNRIERAGLIGPQKAHHKWTLGKWLSTYIKSRKDVKGRTRVFYHQVEANLLKFFGFDRRLETINAGDADDFRIYLQTQEKLAVNTVSRRCRMAKQFFQAIVKKRLITENPFAELKCGDRPNEKRFYYVSHEEAQAALDACPNAEWRLIFALCRYGGLRCPSEVLRLTWADIDWEKMRFTVHASKTEHHAGGGIRQIPIFPELLPYLQECFDQAKPGTEYCITRYRDNSVNLRTELTRIIKRAGLTPWPKLFQNLRSTRETELTQQFPIHVVCKWIGNSQPVATKYYLQVTEEHFEKAVHFPVQYPAVSNSKSPQTPLDDYTKPSICEPMQKEAAPRNCLEPLGIRRGGLEPPTR